MNKRTFDRRRLLQIGGGAALSAAAVSASTTLTGCAHGAGGGSAGSLKQPKYKVPSKYKGRKTEIVVWHSYGGTNGEAMTKLAADFNDSQTDIYADFQFQGSYDDTATKLTAALQTKTGPDLMIVNQVYMGKLLLSQLVDPLDDFIDVGATYIKQLGEEWVVDGKHYQIPFARSTPLFYFNRDVFAKAGLPDRGPKTWSELGDWADALGKVKDPKGKPILPFLGDHSDWNFQAEAWEFGGTLSKDLEVTCATGGALDAAKWFQQQYKDKVAAPGTKETFTNKFAATGLFSTAGLTGIQKVAKFKVGTSFMPKQKESAVPTGGSGWSLLKGVPDDRKQAAGKVLTFLATPENSAYWSTATGYLPVVQAAIETDTYKQRIAKDPYFNVAYKQLQVARTTDAIRSYLPSSTNLIIPALDKMWINKADCTATMKELANKLQSAADKIKPQYEKLYG